MKPAHMDTARTAGYLAMAASLSALLAVFTYFPALVLKINFINDQLRVDSDEFRVIADETWAELLFAKGNFPAAVRIRREVYGDSLPKMYPLRNTFPKKDAFVTAPTCSCNARNNCPAGPPGPPGKPGEDGNPGARGEQGKAGLPGIAPPVTVDPYAGCRVCPMGPRGPPGPAGDEGPAGTEGLPGPPGRNGEDGRPGYPGNPGIPGEPGKAGKIGDQGAPGRDGVRGQKGPPGPKGEAGPIGQKGADGYPGPDGQRGNDGSTGPAGPLGNMGMPGQNGRPGVQGMDGLPGEDAGYCPCPSRSAGVERPQESYDSGVVATPTVRKYTPAPAAAASSYSQGASAAVESNPYGRA